MVPDEQVDLKSLIDDFELPCDAVGGCDDKAYASYRNPCCNAVCFLCQRHDSQSLVFLNSMILIHQELECKLCDGQIDPAEFLQTRALV
jgi:hypothetical protein